MGQKHELTPEYLYSLIKGNGEKIEAMNRKLSKHDQNFREIEEEYPLLPPEADDLSKAVKVKGVAVLGGKKTEAYKDTGLRRRVYQDIYGVIKREYGLLDERGFQISYKKLRRKHLKGAFITVEQYEPSAALAEEIEATNEAGEIMEE